MSARLTPERQPRPRRERFAVVTRVSSTSVRAVPRSELTAIARRALAPRRAVTLPDGPVVIEADRAIDEDVPGEVDLGDFNDNGDD